MENEIDRRSGVDSRTPEEKLELGERRECSDRRAPRRRILKGVRIGFGNDFCSVEGVMRNISDTGALIKLQDGLLIPDEFMIHNELDGYKVSCRVVRRTGNTIGVRFIDEKQPIDAKKHQVVSMIGFGEAVPEEEESPPLDMKEPPAEHPTEQSPVRYEVNRLGRPATRSQGLAQHRPRFGKLGS